MATRITEREAYLFDLQGFLVVPDVLEPEHVERLNEALDKNWDKREEGTRGMHGGQALAGEPFGSFHGMLTWDKPWCEPFRELIVFPKIIPYLNTLLGRGWHMDHLPGVFHSRPGTEGQKFHGGEPHFMAGAHYVYGNGQMRNGMIVFQYLLADVNPGDGGLGVIPGSHKANMLRPDEISKWQCDQQVIFQPTGKAGDLIIFSEATTHGTLPWRGRSDRRAALYRYSPKWIQYSQPLFEVKWPDWYYDLDEAQQAALEPPYLYNRPLLTEDLSVVRPFFDREEPWFRYIFARELHYPGPLDVPDGPAEW